MMFKSDFFKNFVVDDESGMTSGLIVGSATTSTSALEVASTTSTTTTNFGEFSLEF